MQTEVVHEKDNARYVILVDGVEGGELTYSARGDELLFTHTYVNPVHRGLGLGAVLVRNAIDDVLATSTARITSGCWYVTDPGASTQKQATPVESCRARTSFRRLVRLRGGGCR
jgi:predicted GNAT family acetyltransferase